ncbi:hypothetical protein [Terribacillus saccharophilus]|uniref:hypothetical protein n=1 Tax=Terribacillus saccharophilus TaxID=361277 RepID=UPI002989E221|nr:hypothetical protein [Terribacillus saccharophilus]MCM3225963.1 hypothetical protein [Terribacillus saccharophilus]
MAKIKEIMAAKLKVQSENELDAQTVKDRKQRELEELMGIEKRNLSEGWETN